MSMMSLLGSDEITLERKDSSLACFSGGTPTGMLVTTITLEKDSSVSSSSSIIVSTIIAVTMGRLKVVNGAKCQSTPETHYVLTY